MLQIETMTSTTDWKTMSSGYCTVHPLILKVIELDVLDNLLNCDPMMTLVFKCSFCYVPF